MIETEGVHDMLNIYQRNLEAAYITSICSHVGGEGGGVAP